MLTASFRSEMRRFKVDSCYRQFYVADIDLDPRAPEDWSEEHVRQRHNTLKNITALCPEGDQTARIISCGLGEIAPEESGQPDFEVRTCIEVPSGKIGVFGWPWELQDQYVVTPGICDIIFKGYQTSKTDEQEDYYVVRIDQRLKNS
jgi:hypothetical protein